jgi:hypothetical protein
MISGYLPYPVYYHVVTLYLNKTKKEGTNYSPCVINIFIIHSLIHVFNYDLLSACDVSDIVLGTTNTMANKIEKDSALTAM